MMNSINPLRSGNVAENKSAFPIRYFAARFEQNEVTVCGTIEDDAVVYEPRFGCEVLSLILLVPRLSGVLDRIPVCISFQMASLCGLSLRKGANLMVYGQIRTHFDEEGHMKTEVFASMAVHATSVVPNSNAVRITGEIAKQPVYNVTPFGREITSTVLRVPYSDNSYRGVAQIPVIFWGKLAKVLENYRVNETISVYGRFQSREYDKAVGDGLLEKKTTFEVSTHHFTPIERNLINNRGIF